MGTSRKRKLLVALATLVALPPALFFSKWYSGSVRGSIDANFDIARGHYKELGAGLPPPLTWAYIRLLRERYGIEHVRVAGCVVNKPLIAYIEAYNAVSNSAAKRKYGHDVFRECMADAAEYEHESGGIRLRRDGSFR